MAGASNARATGGKPEEPKVFISHRASVCSECHDELGRGAWIFPAGERGALCLSCADLDHLAFLPSGDTAVTRRARNIAQHACEKYSGRVGRSAAARRLDDEAVALAVAAHVRHRETAYDRLLAEGEDRQEARAKVRHQVDAVLQRWARSPHLTGRFGGA